MLTDGATNPAHRLHSDSTREDHSGGEVTPALGDDVFQAPLESTPTTVATTPQTPANVTRASSQFHFSNQQSEHLYILSNAVRAIPI